VRDGDVTALLAEQVEFCRANAAADDEWRAELFERQRGGDSGSRPRAEQRQPEELESRVAGLGWAASVQRAELAIWGTVLRRTS